MHPPMRCLRSLVGAERGPFEDAACVCVCCVYTYAYMCVWIYSIKTLHM